MELLQQKITEEVEADRKRAEDVRTRRQQDREKEVSDKIRLEQEPPFKKQIGACVPVRCVRAVSESVSAFVRFCMSLWASFISVYLGRLRHTASASTVRLQTHLW